MILNMIHVCQSGRKRVSCECLITESSRRVRVIEIFLVQSFIYIIIFTAASLVKFEIHSAPFVDLMLALRFNFLYRMYSLLSNASFPRIAIVVLLDVTCFLRKSSNVDLD